jgi:ribosomal-protein-alanine N-acetyltransferase
MKKNNFSMKNYISSTDAVSEQKNTAFTVTIVPAEENDIPEISKIEAQCFSEPWSENSFMNALTLSSASIYSAKDDKNDVLGYFVLYYASDQAELQNIAVRPGYRGHGIGNALMKQLISECERLEMSQIFLEVRASNEAAKELYKKFGFLPAGIRKNFYRFPSEDAIVEMKELITKI